MPELATQTQQASKICGANTRQSHRPCKHPAGHGTGHVGYGYCKMHGGNTPDHILFAAKLQAAAEGRARVMGNPIKIDPFEALLQTIWISAGEVEYCSMRIMELEPSEALVAFHEQTISQGTVRGERENSTATKTSTTVQLHAWIIARRSALDSLARYSKMAIDAGIAERQVRIAEQVGGMIGRLVQAVLGDLELTPGQQEAAPAIVRRHLTAIAGEAA